MKPGDIVTLKNAGKLFLWVGGFPAPVGALYINILDNTALVLEIEENTVWIKMVKKSHLKTIYQHLLARAHDLNGMLE